MDLFNSTETNYLAFNENVKPFQDVHVRRAISLAINRNAIVQAVLFGNGKPANSLFPPQVPYYDPNTPGLPVQPGRGQGGDGQVVSVPHGFTTTMLLPSGNSDYATIATIMQSELKPLGITVKVQTLDPNTANANFQNEKYDMTLSLWTMDIPDPDELATFGLDPKSGAKSFFTSYDNPTVVKDVHAAEQITVPATRQSLYNVVQTDAAQDAFMAFLYYSPYPYVSTSNVHGFFVTPLGNYHMEKRLAEQVASRSADPRSRSPGTCPGARRARLAARRTPADPRAEARFTLGRMTFVIRRLLLLLPTAVGVTIIAFFMIHLIPGDPARTILGIHATPQGDRDPAPRVGPEPAARQPVLAVHGPAGARQPRPEPLLRRPGNGTDHQPPAADTLADRYAAVLADHHQRAAGDDRGEPQGRASATTSSASSRCSGSACRPSGWP